MIMIMMIAITMIIMTVIIMIMITVIITKIPSKLEVAPPYAKCGVGDG